MISCHIITIGDELLIGQTIDTNSAWMAKELNKLGIHIYRKTTVSDDREDILKIFKEASASSEIVLVTGGLGPTQDDITKDCLCEFYSSKLIEDKEVLAHIADYFKRNNRKILDVNIQQALIPTNATALHNAMGTAPALLFEENNKLLCAMPGVPYEMKYIMENHILPRIKKQYKLDPILHETLVTIGRGESYIADALSEIENSLPSEISLAYLPSFGMVRLRLSSTANIKEELMCFKDKISAKLEDIVIASQDLKPEEIVLSHLMKKDKSLVIIDLLTEGRLYYKFWTLDRKCPVTESFIEEELLPDEVIKYSHSIRKKSKADIAMLIKQKSEHEFQLIIVAAEGEVEHSIPLKIRYPKPIELCMNYALKHLINFLK